MNDNNANNKGGLKKVLIAVLIIAVVLVSIVGAVMMKNKKVDSKTLKQDTEQKTEKWHKDQDLPY